MPAPIIMPIPVMLPMAVPHATTASAPVVLGPVASTAMTAVVTGAIVCTTVALAMATDLVYKELNPRSQGLWSEFTGIFDVIKEVRAEYKVKQNETVPLQPEVLKAETSIVPSDHIRQA